MRLHIRHPHHETYSSRAWIWLHQFELDRLLAQGDDPAGSPRSEPAPS